MQRDLIADVTLTAMEKVLDATAARQRVIAHDIAIAAIAADRAIPRSACFGFTDVGLRCPRLRPYQTQPGM